MQRLPLALALGALGLWMAYVAFGLVCGGVVVEETSPGGPAATPRCVPSFSFWTLPMLLVVGAGLAAVLAQHRWGAVGVGLFALLLSFPALNPWFWPIGFLFVAAGLALRHGGSAHAT